MTYKLKSLKKLSDTGAIPLATGVGSPSLLRPRLHERRLIIDHRWCHCDNPPTISSALLLHLRLHLTFIGTRIMIYSYSKTNKMHLFLKLFILVKCSICFGWSLRPSSGAQNCTYGNRFMSVAVCAVLSS
jgi:hypothetical protein